MGTSASIPSRERESSAFERDSKLDARLDSNIDQSLEYETNSRPSANEDDYYEQEEEEKEEDEDKQLKIRRERAFQVLNTAIDTIHTFHSQKDNKINWMDDLGESLQRIEAVYEDIGIIYKSAYDVALRYRREAGKKMCETKTTNVMFDVVMDCWRVCSINKDDTNVKNTIDVLNSAITIVWNFSDSTPGVSCEIVKEKRFIATLKEILTSYQPSTNKKDDKKTIYKYDLMEAALAIVYNVSQVDEAIPRLRRLRIVSIIYPYLDANDAEVRLITLATLANIIDEKQSEVLKDKRDAIQLLLTTLESALRKDNHRHNGWSARECALSVGRLARNDANKRPLVEMGCLDQLVKLAKKCKTFEEQREAVGAILVLAFDKDNQRKILERTELQIIELLVNLKTKSKDEEVRKAADRTLWLLREQLQNHEKYTHIANSYIKKNIPDPTKKDGTEKQLLREQKGHVMISYSWDDQKELMTISEILREKDFPVWMDITNMGGSKFQEMAEAVEKAHVVLVCFSRKYKNSPNCRAEAEYAFEEGKEIIPLKMDRNYKKDGWLGIVTAGKIFIDFSGKYPFEKKIAELCKRLASSFERKDTEPIESQTMTEPPAIREQAEDVVDGGPVAHTPQTVSYSAPKDVASLRQWTSADVDNWINRHNLPRKEFGRLTGRDLAGLVIMRDKAPECFYRCLKKDLKIKSVATIDMFMEALDNFS